MNTDKTELCTKRPKSHARQCGDTFKSKLQEVPLRTFRIPPTAVGGLFRSNLDSMNMRKVWRLLKHSSKAADSVVATNRKAALEQSTNCRWWDSDALQSSLLSRSDLNNPRTAVGGITDFLCEADETNKCLFCLVQFDLSLTFQPELIK